MKDLQPALRAAVLLAVATTLTAPAVAPPRGTFKTTAAQFGCSPKTVQRLWQRHKGQLKNPKLLELVASKRLGRCGRRPRDLTQVDAALLRVPQVKLQQDNAGPHVKEGVLWVGRGLTLTVVCQPASSPDFNILDLGYFNAIQALQQTCRCKTIVELVQVVNQSFVDLPRTALENVFFTLFRCMEATMLIGGWTTYTIPRSGKAKLRKIPGALEVLRNCSPEAIVSAREALDELTANSPFCPPAI